LNILSQTNSTHRPPTSPAFIWQTITTEPSKTRVFSVLITLLKRHLLQTIQLEIGQRGEMPHFTFGKLQNERVGFPT